MKYQNTQRKRKSNYKIDMKLFSSSQTGFAQAAKFLTIRSYCTAYIPPGGIRGGRGGGGPLVGAPIAPGGPGMPPGPDGGGPC